MVLQWTADSKEKTTIYPSGIAGYTQNTKHDVVERALEAADASGAQVYLGLQINDDWWTNYLMRQVLARQRGQGRQRFGRRPLEALRPPQIFDRVVSGIRSGQRRNHFRRVGQPGGFLPTVGNHLHKLTPGKPIVISPFFNTQADLSPSQWQTMWEYILKRSPIDILALQDGVGAGHATKSATARVVQRRPKRDSEFPSPDAILG